MGGVVFKAYLFVLSWARYDKKVTQLLLKKLSYQENF